MFEYVFWCQHSTITDWYYLIIRNLLPVKKEWIMNSRLNVGNENDDVIYREGVRGGSTIVIVQNFCLVNKNLSLGLIWPPTITIMSQSNKVFLKIFSLTLYCRLLQATYSFQKTLVFILWCKQHSFPKFHFFQILSHCIG